MAKSFCFFLLWLPCAVYAQFSISGRVINATDTRPVVSASVFLSNASVGSTTNNNGNFILKNVMPGIFFNADGKGTYRLLIEGIDNNGNIIRNILRYKVE